MSDITLSELLKKMIELGGSDLHITTNSPPQVRVDGILRSLDYPELTPAETKQLAYSVLTDAQKHRFEETLESRIAGRQFIVRTARSTDWSRPYPAQRTIRVPFIEPSTSMSASISTVALMP